MEIVNLITFRESVFFVVLIITYSNDIFEIIFIFT